MSAIAAVASSSPLAITARAYPDRAALRESPAGSISYSARYDFDERSYMPSSYAIGANTPSTRWLYCERPRSARRDMVSTARARSPDFT